MTRCFPPPPDITEARSAARNRSRSAAAIDFSALLTLALNSVKNFQFALSTFSPSASSISSESVSSAGGSLGSMAREAATNFSKAPILWLLSVSSLRMRAFSSLRSRTDFEMPLARRDAVRSSAGRRPDGRPTARGAPPVKERVAHPGLDAAYGDHEARTPTHGYETTRQAARCDRPFVSPFGT